MLWNIVLPVLAAACVFGSEPKQMVGAPRDVDVNDAGVQNAINFAVNEHNNRSNDMYLSQVSDVISVQKQLVAGYKYTITVRMAKTSCRKGSPSEECAIHQDPEMARPYLCKFTVWEQPWSNDIKLTGHTC